MRRRLKILYPWTELAVNQGFFVPTIRLTEVRREGLREAVSQQVRGEGTPALFNGMIGILFVRKRW